MLSFDLLIPFLIATLLLAFTPGPGMMYTAAQTIGRGRCAGWLSITGLHIGSYIHIAAAAFGLTLLLETVPVAYIAIKFAGAAYLFWLAYKFFKHSTSELISIGASKPKTSLAALWESVVVEVLNPKSAFFFIAFLPQFTDTTASLPIWAQIFVLGTVVNVIFSITDIFCVLLSEKMTRIVTASDRANRWFRRLAGSVFIFLGVNLALSKQ